MKVLLVHARCPHEEISHRQIPLGIAYIGAYIAIRHEVKIYDEPVEDYPLADIVDSFKPQVIGVSYTTQSSMRAYEIAYRYKDSATLVAGGVHATLHPQEALDNGFNIVSYGEGEESFESILYNLETGGGYSNMRGIYFMQGPILKKTAPIYRKVSLDDYPFPARQLLNMSKYDQGSIITSRGCPFNCKFCVSSVFRENNYRHRSVENVYREIEDVVVKYQKTNVHFCDDTFTIDHIFVKSLCLLIIKSGLRFNWSILSRIDTIKKDEEMLALLKAAGCKLIIFGIETGSDSILERINKGISVSQIEDTIALCKKSGLDIKTTWIVGLPGRYDEQMESLKLMKTLLPNQITIHMFIPYPGTELYKNRSQYGISINNQVFMKKLPLLNPGYWDEKIFNNPGFSLDYLTFDQLKEIAQIMSVELKRMGYVYPNQYNGQGAERTFKTFLDKINNPLLK